MDTAELTHGLRRVAEGAPVPTTPLEDDLARGRRSLLSRRLVSGAGAGAVVAVVTGLALGPTGSDRAADPVPSPADAPPPVAQERERRTATLLDPSGDEAMTLSELRAVSAALRRQLDETAGLDSLARIGADSAASWRAAGAHTCPAPWRCEGLWVRGADRARWAESGGVGQLAADFGDRVVVLTVSTSTERPYGLAWSP